MERPLALALSVLVLAVAASCAGGADSSTIEAPQSTIEGVWEGTLQPDAGSDEAAMCLHILRLEEASNTLVLSGALYLDGVWQGIVAGSYDPVGAVSFGGGVEVGSFTGSVEGASAFGVWDKGSPRIDASGAWSLERGDAASCE